MKAFKAVKDDIEEPFIKVAVVGYPNVGKSSLVNYLNHKNVTTVHQNPGTTKATQEVHVEKRILMLDCPGVIPKGEEDLDGLVLRQAVKVDVDCTDPVGPVIDLLNKV